MRSVRHLTRADILRQPWKNGRGVTEELAVWPRDARFDHGDFDWRISKASIAEPGPFSVFPGFDRILVVTHGDGLLLSHGEDAARARVRRFEPYLFAGEWPTVAELRAGAVRDFNVLVRRASAVADVEVATLGRRRVREALGEGQAFVHVVEGAFSARVTGEEEPFELATNDSLWASGLGDGDELDLLGRTDDSVALLVRIRGANDPTR